MDSRELLARILEDAVVLPRAEIVRALVAPSQAIVNILRHRVLDLQELERIAEDHSNPHFGMF